MEQWSANITNDPFDDYNLIIEILFNGEEVAVIRQGEDGLEIRWYPNKEEITIPLKWLSNFLNYAEKRLNTIIS